MLKKPTAHQFELEMVTLESLVPADHLLRKLDADIEQDRAAHAIITDSYATYSHKISLSIPNCKFPPLPEKQQNPGKNTGVCQQSEAESIRLFENVKSISYPSSFGLSN